MAKGSKKKPSRTIEFIKWASLGALAVFVILVTLILLAALTPTPI